MNTNSTIIKQTQKTMEQQTFSTPNKLVLQELKIDAYGGIVAPENSNGIVMVFPENKNAVQLSGDAGTGKTSTMSALLSCLGCPDVPNAVNSISGNKKAQLKFTVGDTEYTVFNSKSEFRVAMKAADGTTMRKIDAPKERLLSVIGNVALDPFEIKYKDGAKQVEWLRGVFKWTPEQVAHEKQLKEKKKEAYQSRTTVNNQVKLLVAELVQSGYFTNDASSKVVLPNDKFNELVAESTAFNDDKTQVQADYNSAKERKEKLSAGNDKLARLNEEKEKLQKDISDLEAKLISLKANLSKTEEAIEKGVAFVRENEVAIQEFAIAEKAMMEFSDKVQTKKLVQTLQQKSANLTHFEAEAVRLTKLVDSFDEQIKATIATLTPAIADLEIISDSAIDQSKPEGLYYKGKALNMLCDSEMMEFFISLIVAANVRIVCIEDLNKYGSQVYETLNKVIKEKGIYVFYTAMERKQDTLKWDFKFNVE